MNGRVLNGITRPAPKGHPKASRLCLDPTTIHHDGEEHHQEMNATRDRKSRNSLDLVPSRQEIKSSSFQLR